MGEQITPNWDVIGDALKSLFSKYDVDLSSVGQSQRLEYSDFETIFYHLFAIIDAAECRRKLWSIYPARNPEERSKFINNAALIINSNQMVPNRISASQLRMFGGEPFRRLLTALIMKAAEVETAAISKRLAAEDENYQMPEGSLEEYCSEIEQTIKLIRLKSIDLDELVQKFYNDQQAQQDLNEEIQEKWLSLMGIEEQLDLSVENIEDNKKSIYKSLLSKLETSMRSRESAKRTIAAVPKAMLTKSSLESPVAKHDTSKRISEYFVNLKRCLLASPQYSPDTNQSRIINKISQRLIDYETGVDEICLNLELEKEKADEALMKNPEMQERYKYFETVIPFVNVKPIDLKIDSNKTIDMAKLRELLAKYPDGRYDDEEILDHFDKNIL